MGFMSLAVTQGRPYLLLPTTPHRPQQAMEDNDGTAVSRPACLGVRGATAQRGGNTTTLSMYQMQLWMIAPQGFPLGFPCDLGLHMSATVLLMLLGPLVLLRPLVLLVLSLLLGLTVLL